MPPQRSSAAAPSSFNNRRPFKPPRPAGSTSNASRSNGKGRAPAAIAISSSDADSDDMIDHDINDDDVDDDDDEDGQDIAEGETYELGDADDFRAFRKNPKSDGSKSVASTAVKAGNSSAHRTIKDRTSRAHALDDEMLDGPPPIPPKLLARLIHDGFEDPNTKIGKEAMAVVTKYIETFVRESIARAVLERQESGEQGLSRSGTFLQVEDLEKLGPQLILDF